jgi:hypothetical protein
MTRRDLLLITLESIHSDEPAFPVRRMRSSIIFRSFVHHRTRSTHLLSPCLFSTFRAMTHLAAPPYTPLAREETPTDYHKLLDSIVQPLPEQKFVGLLACQRKIDSTLPLPVSFQYPFLKAQRERDRERETERERQRERDRERERQRERDREREDKARTDQSLRSRLLPVSSFPYGYLPNKAIPSSEASPPLSHPSPLTSPPLLLQAPANPPKSPTSTSPRPQPPPTSSLPRRQPISTRSRRSIACSSQRAEASPPMRASWCRSREER